MKTEPKKPKHGESKIWINPNPPAPAPPAPDETANPPPDSSETSPEEQFDA